MKRIVNALSKLRSRQRAYAVLALCAATAMAVRAQTFTTLASFDGADGAIPYAGVVQGASTEPPRSAGPTTKAPYSASRWGWAVFPSDERLDLPVLVPELSPPWPDVIRPSRAPTVVTVRHSASLVSPISDYGAAYLLLADRISK
jgi:hypothetical protein